jgi:hypothetical protein
MIPNFNDIKDPKVKELAIEMHEALSKTGQMVLFEIQADDIYCQIGEKESFVFSVEVRGSDAEFFLFDMNFIVSDNGNFEIFKNSILTVIASSINGNYELEIVKFGSIRLSTAILFEKTLKVDLYKNLFNSFLRTFPSQLTRDLKKGQAIVK